MERLLKCFASFFLDMIFCKYSATKLQPPLRNKTWRRYCDARIYLILACSLGYWADPFIPKNGCYEMFHDILF